MRKNNKPSISWEEAKKELCKDKDFVEELEKLKPEYELISQIIKIRIENNVTQEELAERVGTKQSNISRLESGNYNPSLHFLEKVARAVGKKLEVKFV